MISGVIVKQTKIRMDGECVCGCVRERERKRERKIFKVISTITLMSL